MEDNTNYMELLVYADLLEKMLKKMQEEEEET